MLKIAVSFYTYVYNRVKEQYIDDPDINVDGEVQELIDFINQPYKVMLNNIKLIEESDITSIIANRYKILNLNVEKVDLEENLDELMQCVEKIVDLNPCGRLDSAGHGGRMADALGIDNDVVLFAPSSGFR